MTDSWSIETAQPDDPAWRELLRSSPHLVFHTARWGRVLDDGFDGELLCWLIREGGEVRAGLLGVTVGVKPMRFGQLSLPYGGLIGAPVPADVCGRLLTRAARDGGLFRLRLTGGPTELEAPGSAGRGPVRIAGAEGHADPTHVVSLDFGDEEELLRSYKKRVRRDVRRAGRSGLVVRELASVDAVDAFYRLYLATMRRRRATPKYGLEYCRAILRHLGPSDDACVLTATIEGRTAAAMIVADSTRGSHYLFGAADYAERAKQPSDLLIHRALLRAHRRGLTYFDFLPSGDPTSGVAGFKAKFGAEAHGLVNHELIVAPWRARLWRALHASIDHVAVRTALRYYRKIR